MQLYRDYFVCMAFPQPNCVPSVFWYDRNSGQVNSKTVQKRPCAATEVHKLWHKAHFFFFFFSKCSGHFVFFFCSMLFLRLSHSFIVDYFFLSISTNDLCMR